ncbi:MAG: hypothetical protein BMS9Abin17_1519 [Acidimicrobiia bacterium]|nr:MAG: hypothetical protein BMS9Abin17_1519 [Acidimicrobiia bacterium]
MRLVLDARTASFAALIDYAGLFPPASLDIGRAVAGYRSARSSPARWVVGRFLCPSSRLVELAGDLTSSIRPGEDRWEVGVILESEPSGSIGTAAAGAQAFHIEMQPAAVVASAEAKITDRSVSGVAATIDTISSIQPEIFAFLEVDRSTSIRDQVVNVAEALKARGGVGGVKLRCGGADASMFPSTAEVTEFILATTAQSLPFKATAGLHQPVRHFDDAIDTWRHGFVNVLIASGAAARGESTATVEAIVSETDRGAFSVSPAFATWRDISIPGSAMRRTRRDGFVAYGSCEFNEPVEALADLAFLGEGT